MLNLINEDLLSKVEMWFVDRNLQNADPKAQYLKLVEEVGEISSADTALKRMDAYGDTYVTAVGLCLQTGTDIRKIISDVEKMHKYHEAVEINCITELILQDIGELASALARGKDIQEQVTTVLFDVLLHASHHEVTIQSSLSMAYSEIKDRKGLLLNDVYVKYEDLDDEHKAMIDAKIS